MSDVAKKDKAVNKHICPACGGKMVNNKFGIACVDCGTTVPYPKKGSKK